MVPSSLLLMQCSGRPTKPITNKCDDKWKADTQTDVVTGLPMTAMCVQEVDAQSVLQFALIHTVGCTLHRHTSWV